MTKPPELKPCPFCSEPAEIDGTTWRPSDGVEVAWVSCTSCGAYGPTAPTAQAIAAWNTRTPDPAVPADLAEAARYPEILLGYSQGDMDGVMALISRQALHEASDTIGSLIALATAQAAQIERLEAADRAQVEVIEKQAETIIRINARAEAAETALAAADLSTIRNFQKVDPAVLTLVEAARGLMSALHTTRGTGRITQSVENTLDRIDAALAAFDKSD